MFSIEVYNLVTKTSVEYTANHWDEALVIADAIAKKFTVQVTVSEIE